MSFVTDMFKSTGKPADPNAKPADSNAKPADNTPAKVAEPDPNNPSKSGENPLDIYTKLFNTAASNSDIHAPNFAIDPKIIHEVSGKLNFTQGINPELMQKASNGDAAAMVELMNEIGRSSYRAALEHTTKLTDTHLGQRSEFETKRLQRGVKDQLTSDALATSDNTNYNHPVIKEELNRIARSFANSPEYADATPQQIANAAKKYFQDVHAAMNPADPSKDSSGKPKSKEIDYMQYITGAASE